MQLPGPACQLFLMDGCVPNYTTRTRYSSVIDNMQGIRVQSRLIYQPGITDNVGITTYYTNNHRF